MMVHSVLITAVIANISAQIVKIFISYIKQRKWQWSVLISTGGMPSSHAASVSALTAAIAFYAGIGSIYFAIAFCFGAIVVYDAMGIRRHAGKHAAFLNKLIADFKESPSLKKHFNDPNYQKQFKELLGHEPIETLAGVVYGFAVALAFYLIAG